MKLKSLSSSSEKLQYFNKACTCKNIIGLNNVAQSSERLQVDKLTSSSSLNFQRFQWILSLVGCHRSIYGPPACQLLRLYNVSIGVAQVPRKPMYRVQIRVPCLSGPLAICLANKWSSTLMASGYLYPGNMNESPIIIAWEGLYFTKGSILKTSYSIWSD